MGTTSSMPTITFEDIQSIQDTPTKYCLICTMSVLEHPCLIRGTIQIDKEESIINSMIDTNTKYHKHVIIYGKNIQDPTVLPRYHQLKTLGFSKVYIYPGGMFEWLMLQDIYGDALFPTTATITDLLAYKPTRVIS